MKWFLLEICGNSGGMYTGRRRNSSFWIRRSEGRKVRDRSLSSADNSPSPPTRGRRAAKLPPRGVRRAAVARGRGSS